MFDALGAEPWSSLARVELEATGETARKRDPSTLDQLTPQELQIALLLADGSTTREAAAAMFLSPKTIEYHLRNVYRKLGIHSERSSRTRWHGCADPGPTRLCHSPWLAQLRASGSRSPTASCLQNASAYTSVPIIQGS